MSTAFTADVQFTLTDAATCRPIDDLRPHLAAAGDVLIMRADRGTLTRRSSDHCSTHPRRSLRPIRG